MRFCKLHSHQKLEYHIEYRVSIRIALFSEYREKYRYRRFVVDFLRKSYRPFFAVRCSTLRYTRGHWHPVASALAGSDGTAAQPNSSRALFFHCSRITSEPREWRNELDSSGGGDTRCSRLVIAISPAWGPEAGLSIPNVENTPPSQVRTVGRGLRPIHTGAFKTLICNNFKRVSSFFCHHGEWAQHTKRGGRLKLLQKNSQHSHES